jgi:hypothetical protein
MRRKNETMEATDWNTCYDKGETPWEKGRATPVLAEVMARHPEIFIGHALVPGCGLGHDARELAVHGLKVTAVDIAPLAIEKAQALDLGRQVDYRIADIFHPPEDLRGAFDLVWEHTCLCALPPELRMPYAQGVASTLKQGGTVAGVFYMNPDLDPGETGPPFGISIDELEALWREAGFEVLDSWVPSTGYEGRLGRERAMALRRIPS